MAVSFTTNEAEVEALYVGYFGRAGDPIGVNYWVGQLNSGAMTYPQVAASFSVQTEATTMYAYLANPNISNSSAFIDQVYQELFNRVADSAGLTYWQAQLTAGNNSPASIGTFILNVISGAQNADATTVENKVAVATYFTNDLSTAQLPYNAAANAQGISEVISTDSTQASVTTQESNADTYVNATSSGQTYTLTTAVDNIVGAPGSDTFNGTYSDGGIGGGNTFQIGDTLAGGGGANNTLNITPTIAISGGAAATSLVDALWTDITDIQNVN